MKPFNILRRENRRLEKAAANPTPSGDKKYWDQRNRLNEQLREFLQSEDLMDSLTRADMADLLDWCSKYRPVEPPVVLGHFSRMNTRMKDIARRQFAKKALRVKSAKEEAATG